MNKTLYSVVLSNRKETIHFKYPVDKNFKNVSYVSRDTSNKTTLDFETKSKLSQTNSLALLHNVKLFRSRYNIELRYKFNLEDTINLFTKRLNSNIVNDYNIAIYNDNNFNNIGHITMLNILHRPHLVKFFNRVS